MYHRASPTAATAGPLGRLGIIEGFRSILNLASTTVATGQDDKAMAEFKQLRYFNARVAFLPTDAQVAEIRRIVQNPDNAPIRIYGQKDQAAAAWALVPRGRRRSGGVCLQEGKTAGLRQLPGPVQERLGVRTGTPQR
jgi:hypothetical protein